MDIHPGRVVTFPMFKGVPPADVNLLVSLASAQRHARGATLFREGDAADAAFLVVSGRVGVYLADGPAEQLIGEVRPGELMGEAGLLAEGSRRSATARALTDVEGLVLTADIVRALGPSRAVVAVEMYLLQALGRRMRAANTRLEAALGTAPSEEALASRGEAAPRVEAARPPRPRPVPVPAVEPAKPESLTQTLLRILGGR